MMSSGRFGLSASLVHLSLGRGEPLTPLSCNVISSCPGSQDRRGVPPRQLRLHDSSDFFAAGEPMIEGARRDRLRARATKDCAATNENKTREENPWNSDISRCLRIRRSAG